MFDVILARLKGIAFRVLRERGVILCLRQTQMDNREMSQSYTVEAYQILLDDSARNVAYETVIRKLVSGNRGNRPLVCGFQGKTAMFASQQPVG